MSPGEGLLQMKVVSVFLRFGPGPAVLRADFWHGYRVWDCVVPGLAPGQLYVR